jgi:hypothetical protein
MKNKKHINSNEPQRKTRAPIFILTVLLIDLIYPQKAQAGEIYTDTKKMESSLNQPHQFKTNMT